jgi:predicted lysophospholipase L1 biosynthesis ABC-type transport system permease subunit
MAMIGRLKPGVTAAQAHAEIRTIASQLTRENPRRNSFEGQVRPLAEQVSGGMRLAVWVLAAAIGVVMLIVCANLSNLLLARSASREKEIAIRSALGAGRRRLVAQMLTEGVVLSGAGATVGLFLAVSGTRMLSSLEAVRAEGCKPRIHGGAPPRVGAQRIGRFGDRLCVRTPRGRRTADSQPHSRARRRHRVRAVAGRDDPCRSGRGH